MEAGRATNEFPQINDVWVGAKLVAKRDLFREGMDWGRRGLFSGLANQKVFLKEDGTLVISEATIEDDGAFMEEVTILDAANETGKQWRGRAVSNPHSIGIWKSLAGEEYQVATLKAIELTENHSCRNEEPRETS